ncbi:MAG: hypothetical protein AAGB32_05570, partial [Pseudomonadota bacterium]
ANIHTGYNSHQSGHVIKHVESEIIFVASLGVSSERQRFETLFGLYQRISLFLPDYKKTKITDVNNFIGKNASNAVALPNSLGISFPGLDDGESALDIAIPALDGVAITEKAKALEAHSVSDVTGFGNDVAIEAAQIVSKLSYYFTQQAAKPNHTLALVEDIISEARASAQEQFVHSDPKWFERTFSKPQLLPADQMPLAELVQKAVALPTMAANDNEALGKDLEIADHAMLVLGAYHEIIRLHKEALAV